MNHLFMNRRRWLSAAGVGAGALGGIRLGWAQMPTSDAPADQARVVVVMLRGALDGLSLVVPHAERAYYEGRPDIALPAPGQTDGALPLDRRFGLHPAFAPLMPLWQSERMAFVHASGSHDGTRSHFDAQDYMESGTPGRKSTPDGWLNRLAQVLAGPATGATGVAGVAAQRLRAVNLGPTMPRIFSGAAPVASLALGRAAVTRGQIDQPHVAQALARLYAGEDSTSVAMREAAATRREIMDRLMSDDPKADEGALGLQGLPADTARLGELMARDARVRLAFVPVGGWDTHANQGATRGQLANRLGLLAQALDALVRAMGPQRMAETTVLVMSEFGRTVAQNGTTGTDHGHGNVSIVLGGGVRGGRVLGEWPGLDRSALHEGRDLAITTDFRDIVADILERRLRLSDPQLQTVLPGMSRRASVGLFA